MLALLSCLALIIDLPLLTCMECIFSCSDVTVTNYQANRPARKPSTNRAINRLAFEEWQRQQQQDGGVLAPIQPGGMFGWCLYDGQKASFDQLTGSLHGEADYSCRSFTAIARWRSTSRGANSLLAV